MPSRTTVPMTAKLSELRLPSRMMPMTASPRNRPPVIYFWAQTAVFRVSRFAKSASSGRALVWRLSHTTE